MVKSYTTFGQWFMGDEIHEVISNRATLLAEYLHDHASDQASLEDTHYRITKLLNEAYNLGKEEKNV